MAVRCGSKKKDCLRKMASQCTWDIDTGNNVPTTVVVLVEGTCQVQNAAKRASAEFATKQLGTRIDTVDGGDKPSNKRKWRDGTMFCIRKMVGVWWQARSHNWKANNTRWLLLFLPACVRDASTEHPTPHFRGDKHVEFKFFTSAHSEIYSINQSARSLMFYYPISDSKFIPGLNVSPTWPLFIGQWQVELLIL